METFLFLLGIVIWWRSGSLIARLFGNNADALVKAMHAHYILGPRSGIICLFDGAIRGCLIGFAVVHGEFFIAKAIIIQTCIILAGVTTGMQRMRKELRQE
jgi:hypothetical protein